MPLLCLFNNSRTLINKVSNNAVTTANVGISLSSDQTDIRYKVIFNCK